MPASVAASEMVRRVRLSSKHSMTASPLPSPAMKFRSVALPSDGLGPGVASIGVSQFFVAAPVLPDQSSARRGRRLVPKYAPIVRLSHGIVNSALDPLKPPP